MSKTGSIAQVAKGLDLTASALCNWVAQAKVDEGEVKDGSLTTEERGNYDVSGARARSLSRSVTF